MAWDCGAGDCFHILLRCRLALNIFPFPVTTAKLIGEFYNNRRSAAHGCPRFAYSFVLLILCQYYWRCNSCAANRRSAANNKKSAKSTYWRCECALLRLKARRARTPSPISAGRNAAPLFRLNSVKPIGATSLVLLYLFFQNSPITWAVLTGNRNMAKPRWNPNKTSKKCPAPQSEAPTLLLTPFSTHLSFCWTLTLSNKIILKLVNSSKKS